MSRYTAYFTALLCCFSSMSVCADTQWTLGASAGVANYDLDNKEALALLEFYDIGVSLDESDTGMKAWGSYQLNEFVVFEAQWLDLGEAGIEGRRGDNETRELGFSAEGFDLSVLLQAEVASNTDFFIKFGAFNWDLQVSGIVDSDDSGTDLSYGLGVSYQWQHLVVRGEYEFFDLDGLRVDYFSLGAGVAF